MIKKGRTSHKQPRLSASIYTLLFLMVMGFASLAALNLLPVFMEHLGGTPRRIGFLMGLFSLASLVSRPFVGWSLARFNPRMVMIAGLGSQTAVTVLYLFIGDLGWLITVVRVAHGISASFFIVAALLIVVQVVPEKQRAYALGVVSAGFMIPLMVIPYIAEEIIRRAGFTVYFLFALLLVAIPFVYSLFKKMDTTAAQESGEGKGESYVRLLLRRKIIVIVLMTFLFEMALSAVLSFVPLLTTQNPAMMAGLFYTCLGGMAVFMRLYVGRRLRFWGNTLLLIPAFLFLAGGAMLIFMTRGNTFLILSGLIWGLGTGILYPHLSSAMVHGLDLGARGKALSIFAAAVDLGFFAGPVIFGFLSQSRGVRAAFPPFAAIIFISAAILTVWGGSRMFEKLPMPVRRRPS